MCWAAARLAAERRSRSPSRWSLGLQPCNAAARDRLVWSWRPPVSWQPRSPPTLEPLAAAHQLKVTTIFGGVPQNRQVSALRSGVDIVVACPGRLEDLMRQRVINLDSVEVTVVDEADHMADLGFLPGVTRILAATPAGGQRMMFSATLDNGVDKLVKRFLRSPVTHSIDEAHSPVPEMTHHVFHVTGVQAKKELVHHLASGTGRRILFMRTKHQARKLAKQLTDSGVPSVDLHGNLSQPARDRNLAAFSAGEARVLVATDIAARGVHVDDGRTRRARGPSGGAQGLPAPVRPDRTGRQLGRRRHRGAARAAQGPAGTDAQGRHQCPPAGGRRALGASDGTGRRGCAVPGSRAPQCPGRERRHREDGRIPPSSTRRR